MSLLLLLTYSVSLTAMENPVQEITATFTPGQINQWKFIIQKQFEKFQEYGFYGKSEFRGLQEFINSVQQDLITNQKIALLQEDDNFVHFIITLLASKVSVGPHYVASLINTPAAQRWLKLHPQTPVTSTYVNLLPPELLNIIQSMKVGDIWFEQLDNAIARIKFFAQLKPEMHNRLLSDRDFNLQLMKALAESYSTDQAEVAFLLHTPASLDILVKMDGPEFKKCEDGSDFKLGREYRGTERAAQSMEKYLSTLLNAKSKEQREQNKQLAIRYLKRFFKYPEELPGYCMHHNYYDRWPSAIHSIARGYDTFVFTFKGWGMDYPKIAELVRDYIDIYKFLGGVVMQKAAQNKIDIEYDSEVYKKYLLALLLKDLQLDFKHKNKENIDFLLELFTREYDRKYEEHFYDSRRLKGKFDQMRNKDQQLLKFLFNDKFQETNKYRFEHTINYQEFINDIVTYIRSTNDYSVLAKLQKIMPSSTLTEIVDVPDENGFYPLINAVKKGDIGLLRILVNIHGIKVNICQKGHNALWYARNLETDAATRLAIIELLQSAGATEEGVCVVQ